MLISPIPFIHVPSFLFECAEYAEISSRVCHGVVADGEDLLCEPQVVVSNILLAGQDKYTSRTLVRHDEMVVLGTSQKTSRARWEGHAYIKFLEDKVTSREVSKPSQTSQTTLHICAIGVAFRYCFHQDGLALCLDVADWGTPSTIVEWMTRWHLRRGHVLVSSIDLCLLR